MKRLFIKLNTVSLHLCHFSFTEYHIYFNCLDRQACANSVGPNQMQQNLKVNTFRVGVFAYLRKKTAVS